MVTDEHLDRFLATEAPYDPSEPPVNVRTGISWIPSILIQDNLAPKAWVPNRIEAAKKSLEKAIGTDALFPPTLVQQQQRLELWWREEGQFIPRHVLDQIGIVGGEKVPTLKDTLQLERKQQVNAVKDFLAIERPEGKDPLDSLVLLPPVADPDDVPDPLREVKPELADIIKAASIEDLQIVKDTITRNPLDFDEGLFQAVDDEIRIKEAIPVVMEMIGERPLLVLLGTSAANTFFRGLPEFISREGLSPTEHILGIKKGEGSIYIRTVARIREQVADEDPTLMTKIGLNMFDVVAELIPFALLPDPSKATVFTSLSPATKAAIGVGSKVGLLEILKAPAPGETFDERVESVAAATGIGALTGAILSKMVQFVKDIPANIQATRLAEKYPQFSQKEIFDILKTIKENRLVSLYVEKPAPVTRRIAPTGFRLGMAEIEKPGKAVGKAVEKVGKIAPKAKEAAVVGAAKKALELATQPAAHVKPVKILTKKEALSLQQSNMVTGEGNKIRIVADAKTKGLIQTKENEIAKLKTRRNELMAQKKFAVAKATAQEIRKKEEALAKLKEKAGIKLETTIEGHKAKIAKIRAATEFKNSLRQDAVSMITAIPKELRASFINRAARVKTLKGLQKLTDEVEAGVEKFERKIAVGDLRETIKKVESRNRLGKVRMGKIPSPQRERLIEIIDEISLKKISTQLEPPPEEVKTFGELDVKARRGREQLLGADLQSLQKVTQRLSSELAGNLEALNDETAEALRLPDERVRRLNLLTQKNIDEIDTQDIKLVTESIQLLAHNAKLKSQLLTKQGYKPLDGAIKTITEKELTPSGAAKRKAVRIAKGKAVDVEKGKLQKTAEFGKRVGYLDDAHLDTLVELSSKPERDVIRQILDTDIHAGARRSAEKLTKWIDATTERFEKIGFKNSKQIEEKVQVILAGKKLKVDKDYLIKLELHSRDPDNLRAILTTEGWSIGKEKIYYPLDAEGNDLVDRLGELREALKIVREDPILKGIADWTTELNPERADAINEVWEILNGYPIARNPFYTSRPRYLSKRVEGGRDISVPPEQQGRYLPRTGGTKMLKLEKWSDDFLSGLESDASLEMAIPLRNARILVSNPVFQKAMIDAGRELELNNMITILRRTQGVTTSRSILETQVFARVQRGVTSTALGFRMSTVGAQAMSYPAAFSELDTFMRPMRFVGKETYARIEEDSALINLRWKGRRIGVEVGTSAAAESFNTLFFGKAKKLSNIALQKMIAGDMFAIGNIYKQGVIPELLSVPRNGKNIDPFAWEGLNVADLPPMDDVDSKAFRYAAARRLEYVVRRTQPMFDMLDRSVSLSNPNILERQFFIFRTALEAQENIGMRALNEYTKSMKALPDKVKLTRKLGSVIASAFAVAAWKRGLKWAIRTTIVALWAAFGIYKFDDRKQRESLTENIAKDTGKNLLKLTKVGKFAVRVGELIADRVAGEGYNWNRNAFDMPIIDVLESGVDATVNISQAIIDAGLLDEFVEEVTKEDVEFNKQLEEKLVKDIERAIRSSYDFGVRITGQPFLAPVQEILRPALVDSKIKIIREVTFGDVESPQQFSERVFALFEKRKELNNKSKTKRLTREEETQLALLNRFADAANKTADIAKETSDPEMRRLRFSLFEISMSSTESRLK